MKYLLSALVGIVVLYFLAWPVSVDPQKWHAPTSDGYQGAFEANTRLQGAAFIDLGEAVGPEDIAFDRDGNLYTGVLDGSILRIDPKTGAKTTLLQTAGRPLGLELDAGGSLMIADAHQGLLGYFNQVIGRGDYLQTIDEGHTADGSPIQYADDLDYVGSDIYFSDASTKFGAKESTSTMAASILEIWEQGRTGRVLLYDAEAETAPRVVMDNLSFPNGIARTSDGAILVVETGRYRILKHWVKGERKGQTDVFIDNLPGFPDNINRDPQGGYFVGLPTPRSSISDGLSDKPFLRKVLFRVPGFATLAKPKNYGFLMRLDEQGKVLETWQDPSGDFHHITGAARGPDGTIYVSSLTQNRIAVLPPAQ